MDAASNWSRTDPASPAGHAVAAQGLVPDHEAAAAAGPGRSTWVGVIVVFHILLPCSFIEIES